MRDYSKLLDAGIAAQIEKLKENEHKKGFDNIDPYYAFERICQEEEELKCELFVNNCNEFVHKPDNEIDYSAIRKEAADIANFAHMIILKCDKEI